MDLVDAARRTGLSYSHIQRCAGDGKLRTITKRRLRFTTEEWVDTWKTLLEESKRTIF
ncbi:hypothetical protein J2Z48_001766 [Croceifilum oryzae]|uniref:Helix-turn-helix domain-containing protein n=1 Tax=Croceifilum oryzae TaxID=1553429 RepID=A0AAJ1WSP3_9BACL|nr:hypothetical protein [Croceifilum oryzae]MDQ0417593.1 hypothetical protein [Croceifilum oryzae]